MKKGMKKDVIIIVGIFLALIILYAIFFIFGFFGNERSSAYDANNLAGVTSHASDANTNVTVTVGDPVPVITYVQQVTRGGAPGTVVLLAGTTAPVYFNFSARDDNGASDLNDATANAVFSKNGVYLPDTSCTRVLEAGNVRTYQCLVSMNYYSEIGTWNVNVSIRDSNGDYASNLTNVFNVQALKDISINPSSISFPTVTPGSTTPVVSNANTTTTNNGNWVIPVDGNLSITAYDLSGTTNPTEKIPAANFRASGAGTVCTLGSQLVNSSSVIINNINLPRGASGNTDDIAYCLTSVPVISSQAYSTQGGGSQSWKISI